MSFIARAQTGNEMSVSAPVPIRGSGVAGIAEAATAEVGGDIAKLGQTLMTQYSKQQDMQNDNAFQISASKLEGAYATSYEQAKHESNPDGSDFEDKLQQIVAPHVQDILANGPADGPYADKLATANEVIQNKIGARAKIEKISMLEQYNANGASQIGDTFADSVRENPSGAMIDNRTKTYNDYLDDKVNKGIFTPETRDKLMQNFSSKLGMSYVEGLANQGSYGQAVNALRANQKVTELPTDGLTEPGNIDIQNRPHVKNADGSISTVRSMGVNVDGQEVLIPTVSEDGRIMSNQEAIDQYKKTGRHLGKFDSAEASTNYAQALHNQQADLLQTQLDPDEAKQLGLITTKEADQLRSQGQTYNLPTLTQKDGVKLSPAMVQAMSAIDPLKKNALIDQMKNKADAANSLKLSELNQNVSGLEYIAYNGGTVSDAQITQVKNQINQNPSLTGFARVRLMDAVNTAQATNGAIQAMQTAPRSKWQGIVDSFDSRIQASHDQAAGVDSKMGSASSDVAVQANRLQAKNHLESYMAKLAKSQGDDAAQFSIDSDPVMESLYKGTKDNDPGASQKYASQILSRQSYLQVPSEDRSILPNADARAMGAALKNASSSEQADDFINGLQKKWGQYYPQVFNEIAATDKDLKKYSAITYAPTSTRFDLVDAIKNQDVIKKSFDALPNKKDSSESISYAVDQKLRPFAQAVSGSANDSSNLQVVNNFRDALTLQVKRDYVRGNTNVSGSADKAFDDLIGSQFNVVQARNSAIIAPKVYQGQPLLADTISNYISNASTPDGLKQLGVMIPKDAQGKYERDPESFYSDLKTTGKWVTNQDQSGIRLMTTNMDGSLTPVYNKMGRPIESNYRAIQGSEMAYKKVSKLPSAFSRGGG